MVMLEYVTFFKVGLLAAVFTNSSLPSLLGEFTFAPVCPEAADFVTGEPAAGLPAAGDLEEEVPDIVMVIICREQLIVLKLRK